MKRGGCWEHTLTITAVLLFLAVSIACIIPITDPRLLNLQESFLSRLRLPWQHVAPAPLPKEAPAPLLPMPPPMPSGTSVIDFSGSEKYLHYARSADFCAGVSHFDWSFTCALADAIHSNRTFVLDLQYCVFWLHNPSMYQQRKSLTSDMRLYYDYENLKKRVKFVLHDDFFAYLNAWKASGRPSPMKVVDEYMTSSAIAQDPTVAFRREIKTRNQNWWYKVCETPGNKDVLKRPYSATSRNQNLVRIGNAIASSMSWDYDVVHVRRGDKVAKGWPHVDEDTRPPKLVETLRDKLGVTPGRHLYIATNERQPGFFKPLNATWRIHQLDDYAHLWAENSRWYNESVPLMRFLGLVPEFDGYMRGIVDYYVLSLGKRKIETFNDLTNDPRGGTWHRR